MLPQSFPNYKTVHRRFQQWCEQQVLREVLKDLANTLREQGDIDEREAFIDATFASAKGGGDAIGPTKRGKGVKIMAIVDRHGLPLSVSTHAASWPGLRSRLRAAPSRSRSTGQAALHLAVRAPPQPTLDAG
jgi:transposase